MKKIAFLLLVTIGLTSMSYGLSGTFSGNISGAPSSGIPVYIALYAGYSPSSTLLFDDTVMTDLWGNYSSTYSMTPTTSSGLALISFADCRSFSIIDSASWDTSLTGRNVVINNVYCTVTSTCNADFSSTSSGTTVTFNNLSTYSGPAHLDYVWSFGDGGYSYLANPVHTYAANGTYNVCLWAIDSIANCSSQICDSVTVGGTPPPPVRVLSGNVTASSAAPGACIVYLITADSNQYLSAIDSMLISNGAYTFPVTPGTYYVKAALTASNPNYSGYLPTYYNNSLSWATATGIVVTSASSTGNNINLIQGINPGGPGFIGGLVSQGANKTAGPGDPFVGATVILTADNGTGVAYEISDINGEFKFNDLAYGTYELFVDVLGKTPHVRTITLDAENERMDHADFIVDEFSITTGFSDISNVALEGIYPNPAKDQVRINVKVNEQTNVKLVLTDMVGKQVMAHSISLSKGNRFIELNISDLPNGMYLINLLTDNTVKAEKLVKH